MDAGDFFGFGGVQDSLKSGYMVEMMDRLGYDAVTIGERELTFGQQFLLDSFRKSKIELVSANLVYADSKKPFVKPYVIKKYGNVRVAITGVLWKDAKFRTLPTEAALEIQDPVTVMKALVPQLRKKADVVVVLSHLGLPDGQKLPLEVPGIDVMVFGHAVGLFKQVVQTQGVINVRGGERGQYIPGIHLVVEDGKITSYDGEVVTLDDKVPADETMNKLVDTFQDDLNKRFTAQNQQQVAQDEHRTAQQLAGDHYLGEKTCRRCHETEYQKYTKQSHAHAFETLVKAERDATPECIVCHVVGLGQAGGFVSKQSTPDLVNVQCENCHGMGTEHPDGSNPVGASTCAKCHTHEQDPNFNFDAAVEKINHWD